MPRVYASEYDRTISAFRRWFKGKCAMENITQTFLAGELEITQSSVSSKIQPNGNKQSAITYKDLLCFFKAVNASDEEILQFMKMQKEV